MCLEFKNDPMLVLSRATSLTTQNLEFYYLETQHSPALQLEACAWRHSSVLCSIPQGCSWCRDPTISASHQRNRKTTSLMKQGWGTQWLNWTLLPVEWLHVCLCVLFSSAHVWPLPSPQLTGKFKCLQVGKEAETCTFLIDSASELDGQLYFFV